MEEQTLATFLLVQMVVHFVILLIVLHFYRVRLINHDVPLIADFLFKKVKFSNMGQTSQKTQRQKKLDEAVKQVAMEEAVPAVIPPAMVSKFMNFLPESIRENFTLDDLAYLADVLKRFEIFPIGGDGNAKVEQQD